MAKRGFTGAMTRAYGARDHHAVVTETELLAPHFLRVRMVSETLLDSIVIAPTAWLRFWFPDPDNPEVEHQRAYTLTETDTETGRFAVDFVLHEPAGPASAWAQRAVPGLSVQVTSLGSTRFDVPEDLPAGYLLIGDAASIPAINAVLSVLPADIPVELYLEEHDPNDRLIPVTPHGRAAIHWVPRVDESSLAAAIESRDWSDWYAWVTPETGSLKPLRTRLMTEFGFPKTEIHAQGYWTSGRAMGKDREAAPAETNVAAPSGVESSEASVGPLSEPSAAVPVAQPAPASRGSWRSQAGSRLIRPLKSTFITAGVIQGIITLVQLAPFVLLVELARKLIAGAESSELWTLAFWALGLMGGGVLASSFLLLWLHWSDARFSHGLRKRLLDTLARVPLGWFSGRSSGQVKHVVQDDTLSLHYLVTHVVPDAVAAVVAPVAVLIYLFVADWRIALLLLLPVLVYLVTMAIMVVRSGPQTAQALRWAERMNGEASSYLDGQSVIRVFGGAMSSGFRARLGEYIMFLNAWQRPLSGHKAFMDLATRPSTFLLLIVALGSLLVTRGTLAPVDLLPFLFLGTTFGARLLGIGYGLSGLRSGLLAAKRIQGTLDEKQLETPLSDAAVRPSEVEGTHATRETGTTVEFTDVSFSYRFGVPVLDGVSLTLRPGTLTALVGPSGSGKSTLASLLARFHDVDNGSIRLNGQDVRDLTPESLYSHVGFVFQDTQLVHGSVHDNIALAVPNATREAVEAAAAAAHIRDRILRLPHTYDTVLGPDAALSGGERQRIAIARAILADTPVLVLDEATAFADPESEYEVQKALDALTRERTVLVIAHRLHTIVDADQIVVLDHGRVNDVGTHADLLARDGRYRQLWDARAPHATEVAL